MECKQSVNDSHCTCTYTSCSKHGICCECIRSHIGRRELPGCCFPPEGERTYDRSFEMFVKSWKL